jgi:hypothetical protein
VVRLHAYVSGNLGVINAMFLPLISFLIFSRSMQDFELKSVSAKIVPVIVSIGDCHPTHLLFSLNSMVSCRFHPYLESLDLEF